MAWRLAAVVAIIGVGWPGRGIDPPSAQTKAPAAEDADWFSKRVRPILEANCFRCHSHAAKKSKGGLMLDSRTSLLKGGNNGPAIVPGHPEKSLLIRAVEQADDELRMPPQGKLNADEVAVLRQWVRDGAPWPGGAAVSVRRPGDITAEDRAWWAFQPVRTPRLPECNDPDWSVNPIDRFIKARLEREGLVPAPLADPRALVRRLFFDLTGLPPTPKESDDFAAAWDAPQADRDALYRALVDRLLASPRYGERMARLWLDLARYAESDGFRLDSYRPNAWRYRDWVIRAFNRDLPFDQFLRLQLAGDELAPDDPESLVATGFLCHGIYEYNQRDARTQWDDMINEVTDLVGDSILALGISCARCHDHKYDPILQKDYYRLRAFFAPLMFYDDKPLATAREQAEYRQRLAAWEKRAGPILKALAELEAPVRARLDKEFTAKFPKDIQEMMRKPPAERTPLETQLAALAYRQVQYEFDRIDMHVKGDVKTRLLELRKELERFAPDKPPDLPRGLTVRDVGPIAPPTYMPKQGSTESILPGFLTIFDERPATIGPTPGQKQGYASTGRRLALADWLTRPDHPLTSRVLVNRLWQMHFGRGLVATANDFGRLGEPPSHPELLDWLAAELIQPRQPGAKPWSVKHIHRLIVTSRTYRQSALHPAASEAVKKDPDNRLLWRMPTRRLEAEQIRDAILAVAGKLELKEGGPSVAFTEPRRSIYCKVLRNTRDPLLDVFDAPENFRSTGQRNVTTTATQALLMLNSPFMTQLAKDFAARLEKEASANDEARIDAAIRLAFGRGATADELRVGVEFLEKQTSRAGGNRSAALADFCQVLLNANEFVYVD